MTWIRSGECNRCGECCVGDPFNGEEGPASVPGFCPFYRIVDGIGACCDRTNAYYLAACRDYPTDPQQISECPSCSYTFSWVDDP